MSPWVVYTGLGTWVVLVLVITVVVVRGVRARRRLRSMSRSDGPQRDESQRVGQHGPARGSGEAWDRANGSTTWIHGGG